MTTSYKELLAQREALELQIREARKTALKDAVAQIHAIIDEFGLTPQDVFPAGRVSANKGKTVAPKYRDPQTGATWTGRGKPPVWIAGKDRSAFEIK